MSQFRLTDSLLASAAADLAQRDPVLGALLTRHGTPPLWDREPGFPTLIHIILEQQVSLASARAAFDRLAAAVNPITPTGLLALDDGQLKAIGFSRQKMRYARALAEAVVRGDLDLDGLADSDDTAVRHALKQIPGIGDWTVDIYLLMALRHVDAFPRSDLALQVAAQQALALPQRPAPEELLAVAERWRPYRAVAARMLWHAYLCDKAATRARTAGKTQ